MQVGYLKDLEHEGQKNPSKSARTKHFIQDVMSNDVFKERTNLIHDMVKKYMKIVDTTIKDMAPKYIIMFIAKAVSILAKAAEVHSVQLNIHQTELCFRYVSHYLT